MSLLPIFFAFILLAFIHCSTSLTSNFTFPPFTDGQNLKRYGDAFVTAEGYLDLTSTDRNKQVTSSTGWAIYAKPITLYDARTGFAANFQSNFSFEISPFNTTCNGDGLAFFMAPADWTYNVKNSGYGLGIFNTSLGADNSQMIAVEFDTYYNWECDPLNITYFIKAGWKHMGIDINSYVSKATTFWATSGTSSTNATALVQYDSTTGNLSSHMMDRNDISQWYTSFVINLTTVLPETVIVGFSASTGGCSEGHRIVSWNFSITAPNWQHSSTGLQNETVIILVVCFVPLLIFVVVIILSFIRRKNEKVELKEEEEEEEETDDFARITMNFETGPKKFRYTDLAAATNDFSEEGKLGQGGFGGVYRGILRDTNEVVAVKRFSKGSKQGKKEYVAEVTVISRLRHRNLVRLIGWCHERFLPWAQRMKVVLGLGSAILYLHEEWEKCVVHRDIKLSNVMVDSDFNARLGDFGLARLTNHGFAARTTMIAGTMGYLAPECAFTGKFSTRSDVYSFGVVLLEIATGRRATCPIGEEEACLVEWTWEFYGLDSLMEAVDERLETNFDEQEMERMMVVGLWCVHPYPERRPTIREAIKALSLQANVPSLPQKMPMPFYAPLPTNEFGFLFTSSSGTTGTSTTA
ncbi:putative L-type lectin-domain containing receptor kinase S-5 [Nymphaea thermarum]|nr:putative L-type lectin-domain containing receptor kinase S-5 [Nymphaea thermarum]